MDKTSRSALLLISILSFVTLVTLVGWLAMPTARQVTLADAGGFSGQVTDLLTGQPIVGAQVSAGDMQAATDPGGSYRLRVAPGVYEIRVRAAGYIGMSRSRQIASEDRLTTVDFGMVVADPSPEQRGALDAIFRQQAGAGLTAEALEAADARGFIASGMTQLPATIRVLMEDGTVVVMPLDEYVRGVVPNEMAPYWPPEALKAQAVAARCYAATARRHTGVGANVCTTQHCQVWRPTHYETTDLAVASTHNVAATYGGNIISAFYFAHCDGHTRNSEDVWLVPLPYCRSVSCPCGYSFLLGHSVGMCQRGAEAMANQGADYREILTHYYTGVRVAAPPAPALREGRVTPEEGDTATIFTYEVLYSSSDPPIATNLYIDGYSYNMSAVTNAADGDTLYRYSTLLPAGEHTYVFHFENGYNPPVNLPTSGVLSGPDVGVRGNDLPTPTPLPTPQGTQASQWSQTTLTDFADGTRCNTVLTSEDNGEVALAPYSTLGLYTSTVTFAPIDFVAVGSKWQATTPAQTEIAIAVRSSPDNSSWSAWMPILPMDAEREAARLSYGGLVFLRGPYLQYRLTFSSHQPSASPTLHSLTLIFIDSQPGPTAQEAQALAIATVAPEGPVVIPRAAWGADESLMTWPPEYRTPRKFVIHHTATPNADLDPAAMVRAIYYYHGITRGWGDIGYNYLVDPQGRIYEGRWGGEGVVGGHAKIYNWGSIGVALIGNYAEIEVPANAENSLIELLAWKGNLHFIHPTGHGFFIDRYLPNIIGHRDVGNTACPGRYAYARLPYLRQAALTRMGDLPPNVRTDAPLHEEQVRGVVDVLATASPAVAEVILYVDDVEHASGTSAPFSWKWNTVTATAGQHVLRVEARTAIGLLAEDVVTVTVDNTPPNGSLSGPIFTNAPTVTLTTWADNAQWMQFSNGWRWEGEHLRHQTGHKVSDTAALNGWAWLGRAGSDPPGWWYGPYFHDLPTGSSYRVYFRLKTEDNVTSDHVATIDLTDDFGTNTYVSQALTGRDFAGSLTYQEPYLDFYYSRHDVYGLEFRTFYTGRSDLYVDRIYVFRTPRSYATSADWVLPAGDGSKEVEARYIDAAGNASAVYSITVVLDGTPPQWLDWDGTCAWVHDDLSGLHVGSAQFATSTDGGLTWGDWRAATITATEGTTATVALGAPANGATSMRFRIADRADNLARSPVYHFATPTPTATITPVATPGPGSISGRVILQGRGQHDAANVSIAGVISTTTAEDGSYVLSDVPSGSYTVMVRMRGYVETYREEVTVSAGAETALPDVTLCGGDVNGDCSVDLFDLVGVASDLYKSPSAEAGTDINNDGRVDLHDLLLVSINLGKNCPGPW